MTNNDPSPDNKAPSKSGELSKSDNTPTVAVVVLNWNNYEDTAACLRSLTNVSYSETEIYVADNGSTDGSGEQLAAEFPEHEFVFNGENLGFAAGCNPAIDRALSHGAEYVLLLNNDAQVKPNFLRPLVQTAETHERVAAVGGIILDESGNIRSAGGKFYPTLTLLRHRTDPADTVYETKFISGGMILLSSEFINEVGGLNENYFFGMEDEELAWEAQRRDWQLLIDPRSKIIHEGGASAAKQSPFRYYHDTRNRLTFATTNLPAIRLLIFIIFFSLTRFIRSVQWGIRGQREYLHATASAVLDHAKDADYRMVDDFNDYKT
ncbi:glycosyltransferase family 2 protein [Halobaculum sp. EA56]|uniref:glycosyltransferase family 2 protein n=1 Tax=Halobaculum sp. EA56 TaxID=3421648 RepID=UPI003EB917C0